MLQIAPLARMKKKCLFLVTAQHQERLRKVQQALRRLGMDGAWGCGDEINAKVWKQCRGRNIASNASRI
jgi:hypothetical protein